MHRAAAFLLRLAAAVWPLAATALVFGAITDGCRDLGPLEVQRSDYWNLSPTLYDGPLRLPSNDSGESARCSAAAGLCRLAGGAWPNERGRLRPQWAAFSPDYEIYKLLVKAKDAMQHLCTVVHYASCKSGVGRSPDPPGAVVCLASAVAPELRPACDRYVLAHARRNWKALGASTVCIFAPVSAVSPFVSVGGDGGDGAGAWRLPVSTDNKILYSPKLAPEVTCLPPSWRQTITALERRRLGKLEHRSTLANRHLRLIARRPGLQIVVFLGKY